MMHDTSMLSLAGTRTRVITALFAVLMSAAAIAAEDDPPGRVARVNLLDGSGAMEAAGTDEWVDDLLNRPLTGGDKVWIEAGSRAEMHIGSSALRLGARTALQILTIDDRGVRLRADRRVAERAHSLRSTPTTASKSRHRPVRSRCCSPAATGSMSTIATRGRSWRYGVGAPRRAAVPGSGSCTATRPSTLTGDDDPAPRLAAAGSPDSLDLWAEERDHREDESRTARYVSRDVVGYEELDGYGDWVVEPDYGSVWYPQVVIVDWAPYRFGHWAWIGPWGWTWIDDQPWGFAPCHYGRWVHMRRGWGWAPGEREGRRPVFAPALVAWRGDRYPRRIRTDTNQHRALAGCRWDTTKSTSRRSMPAAITCVRRICPTRACSMATSIATSTSVQRAGNQNPERRYANERVPGAYTDGVARYLHFGPARGAQSPDRRKRRGRGQAPFSARGPEVRPEPRSVGRICRRPAVVRPDRSVFERPVMRA